MSLSVTPVSSRHDHFNTIFYKIPLYADEIINKLPQILVPALNYQSSFMATLVSLLYSKFKINIATSFFPVFMELTHW